MQTDRQTDHAMEKCVKTNVQEHPQRCNMLHHTVSGRWRTGGYTDGRDWL